MRKLLKKYGVTPATIVTDRLGSYNSALRELGIARRHETGASRSGPSLDARRMPLPKCYFNVLR